MFSSLANWLLSYSPTPEKLAQRELGNMRLELYKAEQMVLDAQQRAEYFRKRIEFLELVAASGIERAADLRINTAPRRGATPLVVEKSSTPSIS